MHIITRQLPAFFNFKIKAHYFLRPMLTFLNNIFDYEKSNIKSQINTATERYTAVNVVR